MKKIFLLFFLFSALVMNAQNSIQEEINARLVDLHEVGNNDENFAGFEQIKVFISDARLGTDNRDQQMAENLIWIKKQYPGKKIICWGATSHFLYNSSLVKLHDKKIQKSFGDYYLNHKMRAKKKERFIREYKLEKELEKKEKARIEKGKARA